MLLENFRHDPWTDTDQPAAITGEKHVIPPSSPFIIYLREMPRKVQPSTITLKMFDVLTAAITTTGQTAITVAHGAWWTIGNVIMIDAEKMQISGIASNTLTVTRGYGGTTATTHSVGADVLLDSKFTEKTSAPAAKEYWPDYNATVAADESWNSAALQFNAADAGRYIIVNYDGMGSMGNKFINEAHVPAVWTNTGTGADGNFVSTGNVTMSGEYNYKHFHLQTGHTITAGDKALIIRVQGTAVIEGTITADGMGAAGVAGVAGTTPGNDGNPGAGGAAGGGGGGAYTMGANGGAGGKGWIYPHSWTGTPAAATLAVIIQSGILSYGGGGGSGGGYTGGGTSGAGSAGGGMVAIIARNIIFTGSVTAKGINGGNSTGGHNGGGGGGAGGAVVMAAKTWLADTGTISVAGGTGGAYTGNPGTNGAVGSAGWSKKYTF